MLLAMKVGGDWNNDLMEQVANRIVHSEFVENRCSIQLFLLQDRNFRELRPVGITKYINMLPHVHIILSRSRLFALSFALLVAACGVTPKRHLPTRPRQLHQ